MSGTHPISVELRGQHLAAKAYAVTLSYSPEAWIFERGEGDTPLFIARPDGNGVVQVIGGAANGFINTDVPVATMKFRRLLDSASPIKLVNAVILDSNGDRIRVMDTQDLLEGPERKFSLLQNFPNPFNPETQISYILPEDGPVRMTVFNILGQVVRRLVFGPQAVGQHTVHWNGRDDSGRILASGVYIYRIEAGKYSATRKMVFMK